MILFAGIVAANSIVLVDSLSHSSRTPASADEGLIVAASDRIRPVLMTSLTSIADLTPMLLIGDHSSLRYFLALGTMDGLVSSGLLTLMLVPLA